MDRPRQDDQSQLPSKHQVREHKKAFKVAKSKLVEEMEPEMVMSLLTFTFSICKRKQWTKIPICLGNGYNVFHVHILCPGTFISMNLSSKTFV
jgi:hypothetical protein